MRKSYSAFTAACLCLLLSACNTSEALTPKAEVPNAADTTNTAENRDTLRETPVRDTVANQDMPPVDRTTSGERAPQNTLEAQAQALERGEENPSLTKPENASLSANLYKSNNDARPANNLYSATQAKGTIRFLPIIGAPVQSVTPLSRELGSAARGSGLEIKGSNDQTAEHVLKGYLSAFSDGKNVTVIYVWDVLDNAGTRLHRIQGQKSVAGRSSDAWAAVPPELMQQIGADTISEYMQWRQSQG